MPVQHFSIRMKVDLLRPAELELQLSIWIQFVIIPKQYYS